MPTEIRARIQDGVSIAEFWTPGAPEHLPWPAAVIETTFGKRSWTLFTAGELQGAWMMTVDRDTGDARLSSHFIIALRGTPGIAAARGTCIIQEEQA